MISFVRLLAVLFIVTWLPAAGEAQTLYFVDHDARTLARGQVEASPTFAEVSLSDAGRTDRLAQTFGADAFVGLSPRASLGVSYARVHEIGGPGSLNMMLFGPKISLASERVALLVPVGFMFGRYVRTSDTFHVDPTAIVTLPVGRHVDLNPSVRYLVPFCDGCSSLLGIELGVGIRHGDRVTFRPAFGVIVHPGDSGALLVYGFAVSLRSRP